ncbi:MAG TPA: alkaline phosphatase PafA [Puia sp.]|nr:alkaline phosphatase PafA [Puia sp.]
MNRKFLISVCFFVIVISSFAQNRKALNTSSTISRPRLVVGIVVDQMRWDYLYRYYDRYGHGGFKRLLNEGFSCENTMIIHLPAFTAVGHSCIFTGSVPSINGIAGNDWIEQLTGKHVYCTEDSTVQSIGNESEDGKMSPRNLLTSTVTDELRIATNYQSRVVGVSLKDRAAILPAGHSANAAYWFDDASGHFITSSYYMDQLPDWVNAFNNKNEVVQLIQKGWNTLYPVSTYMESDSDNESYEGKFKGETSSTFPHDIAKIYETNKGSFRQTPFGNTLTLDFAKAVVENYKMGNGKATDFLTINCASTDYVGHFFGPNSVEIEDTYLRLDKDLENFFQFLDGKIGKGKYTVFLTADHGAAHAIGYMQKNKLPAEFLISKPIIDSINQILEAEYNVKKLVISGQNYQVNYDMKKIYDQHLDFDAVKKTTVDFLQRQPGIQYAVDVNNIGEAPVPGPIKEMIINGYNFKRSGAVQVIVNPGWFEGYAKTGTTHGTWNPYDTHIPLLFMGWGIHHGSTNRVVHMTDIAPTVSAMLHIQMPNGCIGEPIKEVIGNN